MANKTYKLYQTTGNSQETLVLIAGSAEGQYRWEPFLDLLTPYYNVILIDNPGVGVAEYEANYSARSLAIRYQSILDELSIENYNLIGHSFGSFIAQHMALNEPARVKNLVLIGTSCGSFNQERIIRFQLESTQEFIAAGGDLDKQLKAFSRLFGESYPKENLPQYRIERTLPTKEARFSYVLNSAKHANFKEILDLTVRTLIVQGIQDWIVDIENAYQLNALLPNSQLLALDNVGHYPYMEDDSVWPAIISFLFGNDIGVTSDETDKYDIELMLKKDKAFKSAILDEEGYKQLLISIFINKDKLSVDELHQQYIDFVTVK